jgi:hypothetical protein
MNNIEFYVLICATTLIAFALGSIAVERFLLKKNQRSKCNHKWDTQNIGHITTTKEYSCRWGEEPYTTVTVENKLFSVCSKCGEHNLSYETIHQYEK